MHINDSLNFQHLKEISRSWSNYVDLTELLTSIIRNIIQELKASCCAIFLYDHNTGDLLPQIYDGFDANILKELSLRITEKKVSFWEDSLLPDGALCVLPLEHAGVNIGYIIIGWPGLYSEIHSQKYENALHNIIDLIGLAIYTCQKVEDLREQLRGFSIALEINSLKEHNPSLELVLGKIIERIGMLLEAEKGGILLYDNEANELSLHKPAFGFDEDEEINAFRVPIAGGGNLVQVYLNKKPVISENCRTDKRLLKKFVDKYDPKNLVAVPLELDKKRIGVITFWNKKTGSFTWKDMHFLGLFSRHVALLIENTRLDQERFIQKEKLQKALAVHKILTAKVFKGEGIQGIAQALGSILGCHVTVLNHYWQTMGSVGNLNGLSALVEEQLVNLKTNLKTITAIEKYIRVPIQIIPQNKYRLYLSPIYAGKEKLGYLLISRAAEIRTLDAVAIEQATTMLALEFMKEQASYEAELRSKGDFLEDLLSGQYEEASILRRASFLGCDLTKQQWLLVLAIKPQIEKHSRKKDKIKAESQLPAVTDHILASTYSKSLIFRKGSEVLVIMPAESTNLEDINVKARILKKQVEDRLNRPVVIGIGSLCEKLSDYVRAYQQAANALKVLNSLDLPDGVLRFEQLGIYSLLAPLVDNNILRDYVNATLSSLLEHEQMHRSGDLLTTLELYIDNDGNLKETAAKLFIHVNTLRYRLNKIEEITGMDIKNKATKLQYDLAIKALKLL